MTDIETSTSAGEPTDEELAAILTAVRLARKRRGRQGAGASHWTRAGRTEAIAPQPRPAAWRTVERPW